MSYDSKPGAADHLLILRGLASLGVLVAHCFNVGEASGLSMQEILEQVLGGGRLSWLLEFYPETGWNFVLCFFVLSGYLMGKVFFNRGRAVEKRAILDFYKRRFLRIAPLMYFNLLLCLFLANTEPVSPLAFLGDVLFLNNLTGTSLNPVTWSISYEMQYYLLAPFVFRLFSRGGGRSLAGVLVLLVLTTALVMAGDRTLVVLVRYLPFFLAGFAMNLCIRLAHPRRRAVLTWLGYALFVFGNVTYYYFANRQEQFAAETVICVAMAAALWMLELPTSVREEKGPGFVARALTLLGAISYGVYLWHYPILQSQHSLLVRVIDPSSHSMLSPLQELVLLQGAQLALTIAFTLILSVITFFFVELRYRKNLYNAESSGFGKMVAGLLGS